MPIIIKFDLHCANRNKISLAPVSGIQPDRTKPCLWVRAGHLNRAVDCADCHVHTGDLAGINTGTERAADSAETVNRRRQSIEIGNKARCYKIIGSDINKEIATTWPAGKICLQTAPCVLVNLAAQGQETTNASGGITGHADCGVTQHQGGNARVLMRQRHPAGADSQALKSVGRKSAASRVAATLG